ncbi:MAG: hypothetical protein CVU69_13075 [Deltaproteobacteria bacterium HGW-Deltaproteobacteria-4]|nr:MAG: hypothetical protein CVU69_13075 [Deltaproteobacteria bacterium HGW-Deltaproteobacteria-4]
MRWLTLSPLILTLICVISVIGYLPASAGQPPAIFVVEVADIDKSGDLVKTLKEKGISAVIFPKNSRIENAQINRVIWLGKNVPLEIARITIREALIFNPYICFIHLVGDRGEKPPEKVNNTIHVGGSEEAALAMKLAVIPAKELQQILDQAETIEELHRFIRAKNGVKP